MPLPRLRSQFSYVALVTLVGGIILSLVLTAVLHRLEKDKAALDFEQLAVARTTAVKLGFGNAIRALLSTNQLFASMGTVSREQFSTFSNALLKRNPHVQALVFHRLVQSAERAQFEADRRTLFPGFRVTERGSNGLVPAGVRDFYVVDDYIEPMAGNEISLGYDAWSEPPTRDALQKAIDSGLPQSSELKMLLQDTGAYRGLVIMMPVYRQGAVLTDVASRRLAFTGDTEVVLNAGALISGTLKASHLLDAAGININVYASNSAGEDALAFRHGAAPSAKNSSAWLPRWLNEPMRHEDTFDVAGKSWLVTVSASGVSLTHYLGSIMALVLGTLLSILAAAYVHVRATRSKKIERLVEERTADLKRTSDALRLHKRAIASSANMIAITNAVGPDYAIEYVNPAFERILGYTQAEVIGRSLRLLGGGETAQPNLEEILAAFREKREGNAVLRNFRKDGSLLLSDVYVAPVKNDAGETEHFIVTQYDVTATKAYEAELEMHAKYDPLTGLANRSVLHDRLNQAAISCNAQSEEVWAVMIDLSNFKFVNDTLGHDAGDAVLKAIAERLKSTVRRIDTIARLGGDEYVLVLSNRVSERSAMGTLLVAMDAIAQPLSIEGHELFLTSCVGVAVYPTDGSDPATLLKHAEIAMYRAKKTGPGSFQFYAPAMNDKALERLKLESDLRNALDRNEFELHYQPQVDLCSGRIVGMEALIRWRHPDMGMVPPGRFIGLAEETGLIVPIGVWVIRTACAQSKAWQVDGLARLRVAVNLSARQFAQDDLAQTVADILEETGLAAEYLEIELTESLVMADVEQAIGTMRALKALGVQLSIDDFGTGYSSLSYLKRFPIDVLKIDQSFVRDITVNADDAAVALAIISLAHSLRLHVIAEGVETEEQLEYLRSHNCDQMQGYYFSRPVPAGSFEQLLKEGKCLSPQVSA